MLPVESESDPIEVGGSMNRKHEELLDVIATLSLLDDNLMTLVFDRNIEATELLLNTILERHDLNVLNVVAQREYKNPMAGGRSVKFDIYAVDGDGKNYDIEIQRAPSGADAHRARFHNSMMDTRMLKTKQEFRELHDSYVIFITASDVIGAGCSLYHINRRIEETGTYFGDGSYIIYVNGSYKNDGDPIGKLMHDFRCINSADMFYPTLATQVKYFKETKGGQEIMCKAFEDLAEKRADEKVLDEKARLIKNLMESMHMTEEQVMEAMKLSEADKQLLMSRL